MTPELFRTLAEQLVGRHWKTHLGPLIGRSRIPVWEYANGKRPVPEPVRS